MTSSKLWIEFAYRAWPVATDQRDRAIVRTLTTESNALALVASGEMVDASGFRAALGHAWDTLAQAAHPPSNGVQLDDTIARLLSVLPARAHLPWALLQAGPTSETGSRLVNAVECDAPPLFFARRGELRLPPVSEEEVLGHLVRRSNFDVRDGDHLALVSEHYIRARGGSRPWSWRDIAVSIRRLIEMRCDAEQLADALMHSYQRFAGGDVEYPVSVVALAARPMRTATVWSGPPSQPALDAEVFRCFMTEEDVRIICGDTTAEIAARLLGAKLVMESPPAEGWREVPPTSQLIAADGGNSVALVGEGVVTMQVARERLAGAERSRELAGRRDGASRLARLLLVADQVRFLVGLAVNPAQATQDGVPLRVSVIEKLADDLRARGKIVSVIYF